MNLHARLTDGTYKPSNAIKLFFPKKSGIQRIYTLLSVEDHIVYQALVNVIAEKLYPVVKKRYLHSVFGNLYAGQRSRFLYREWRKCYGSFTKAVRNTFSEGYKYTVSFDLTACYDSIDHAVLKHMLTDLGISRGLCECLCKLLSHWSASSSQQPIYQGHGIPQGPLPSGILSECVLRYFDEHSLGPRNFRYFRYVDDIRLFAKSEHQLRKQLINLDLRSKEIGLFPQSSKIDLHLVTDIEEEVKSISHPIEPIALKPSLDQVKVQQRLNELSPRFHVEKVTRFKYVLARAVPQAKLSKRLLVIVQRQPHLYESIFYYFSRAETLPEGVSRECVLVLKQSDSYPAFSAALIRALVGRIHSRCNESLMKYCQARLIGASRSTNPELRVAAASALLEQGLMGWNDIEKLYEGADWWIKAYLAKSIRRDIIGEPSYEALLNTLLRDSSVDVAIVAADLLISESLSIKRPVRKINTVAQLLLRETGIIGRVQAATDPIQDIVADVIGSKANSIEWRKIFGEAYRIMQPRFVRWRGYAASDATAWVNLTNTINDHILSKLFQHDPTIGTYELGKIGSCLNSPTSRLANKYPLLFAGCVEINNMRGQSDLSHPITRKTSKPTSYIDFNELPKLKGKLLKGYLEIWNKW